MGALWLFIWWEPCGCLSDGSPMVVCFLNIYLMGTLWLFVFLLFIWWEPYGCLFSYYLSDGSPIVVCFLTIYLMGSLWLFVFLLFIWWETYGCLPDGSPMVVYLMGALWLFTWWEPYVCLFSVSVTSSCDVSHNNDGICNITSTILCYLVITMQLGNTFYLKKTTRQWCQDAKMMLSPTEEKSTSQIQA